MSPSKEIYMGVNQFRASQSHVTLGSLFYLRPRVNLAARLSATPGQTWGPRTISDCQLIYVVSGRVSVRLGPHDMDARRGECLFFGSNSPHRIVASVTDPFTFVSIHFDWDAPSPEPVHPVQGIRNCPRSEITCEPVPYQVLLEGRGEMAFPHFSEVPDLEGRFVEVVREFTTESPGYASTLSGLMAQILIGIARRNIRSALSSEAREKVRPALGAIRSNPGKSWRVPDLADLCGFHPTYFAALFKEGTGESPKRYIRLERVRWAQNLLLGQDTVEATAEKAGFSSVHYFCRVFKAETGITPTEFRRLRTIV